MAELSEEQLNNAERAIRRLDWWGRNGATVLKVLAVVVTLELVLGAVVAVAAFEARSASRHAASAQTAADLAGQVASLARQGVLNNCEAANESRRSDRQLWEFILQIAPATGEAEQERAVRFRRFLDQHLAERDCVAIANAAPSLNTTTTTTRR